MEMGKLNQLSNLMFAFIVSLQSYILFCALMSRYSAEEIEEKVNTFRMMLQEKEEPSSNASERPA